MAKWKITQLTACIDWLDHGRSERRKEMYLARIRTKDTTHYFIRESYPGKNHLLSRDLFYLGTQPWQYIIYPGGNAYYIEETIENRLHSLGVNFEGEDLDDIFWPFVKPDVKKALEHFRGRVSKKSAKPHTVSADQFHLFDRRRVHFLRYGQMDQGRIGRVSPKLFQVLQDKSRDEIEQYFLDAEHVLKPHEIKSYVFVAFDIQKHFNESFCKTMPQGLDQNMVDQAFLKEVCRLCDDRSFWASLDAGGRLHDYLARYVIMFFDNDYGRSDYLDDFVWNWMNHHREYRPPQKIVSAKEASGIFGVTETELRQMSTCDLSRLFRRKAQELHPDRGGDHESFIRLVEAFQSLKDRKS